MPANSRPIKKLDLRKTDEPSNKYDIIICYHILEHIVEDQKAMQELKRILKKTGTGLIQTPFKEGKIYEDLSAGTSAERMECYGQADHVRIYSVEGLKERLEKNGLNVTIKRFSENKFNGMTANEVVLLAGK